MEQIRLHEQTVTMTKFGGSTNPIPTGVLYIGRTAHSNWASSFLKSRVDDFRVYNKTLTQEEISQLYNTQTLYNAYFFETTGTLCDMLIARVDKYRYLTDISLNGLYTITVGRTSSLTITGVEIYDYNLTNLPAYNWK